MGRLAEPSLAILTSLATGPRDGFSIAADVEAGAGVRLGPGTLYSTLSRLEHRGLVEVTEADDGHRRYRLTGQGAATLRDRPVATRLDPTAFRAHLEGSTS
jgi:DNA-binding PadR family transcriptional regulator